MKKAILIFICLAAVFVAGFFVFRNFSAGKRDEVPLAIKGREDLTNQIPDYSGIKVLDLFFKDLRIGSGAVVDGQSKAKVSFEGWIYNPAALGNKGQQLFFKDPRKPRQIDMKEASIMQGLKEGITGMGVGGLRQVVIPPHLVSGDKELEGHIPANAIVLIEVELLSVN